MTLLLTVIAAVTVTVLWYNRKNDDMRLGTLCFLYWGASFMWFVDAIFEYLELRSEYFTPAPVDMLNDSFLVLSVIVLGLIIWLVRLLVEDPKGSVRKVLVKQSEMSEQKS